MSIQSECMQASVEDVLFEFVVWVSSCKKKVISADTDCHEIMALADEFCKANHAREYWAKLPVHDYNRVPIDGQSS